MSINEIINLAHQTYGFIANEDINRMRHSARLAVGQVCSVLLQASSISI